MQLPLLLATTSEHTTIGDRGPLTTVADRTPVARTSATEVTASTIVVVHSATSVMNQGEEMIIVPVVRLRHVDTVDEMNFVQAVTAAQTAFIGVDGIAHVRHMEGVVDSTKIQAHDVAALMKMMLCPSQSAVLAMCQMYN